MFDVKRLFVNGPGPSNQVCGNHVHQPEVGRSPTWLQFHPRAKNDRSYLQDNAEQAEESGQHFRSFRAVLLFVEKAVNVFHQPQGKVSDGAKTKEDGADPDESRGVATLVRSGGAGTREAKDEVDEKED